MPKLFKKEKEWPRVRFFKARNNYVVDAGTKISPIDPITGERKRIREYYSTKQEAELFAEQWRIKLKNEGLGGFTLSKNQQVDAEKALQILNGKASLVKATEYFMRFNNRSESDKAVSDLVTEFLDHKKKQKMLGEKGASDRTINDYKHRLGLLSEQFGNLSINEFNEGIFLFELNNENSLKSVLNRLDPVRARSQARLVSETLTQNYNAKRMALKYE